MFFSHLYVPLVKPNCISEVFGSGRFWYCCTGRLCVFTAQDEGGNIDFLRIESSLKAGLVEFVPLINSIASVHTWIHTCGRQRLIKFKASLSLNCTELKNTVTQMFLWFHEPMLSLVLFLHTLGKYHLTFFRSLIVLFFLQSSRKWIWRRKPSSPSWRPESPM